MSEINLATRADVVGRICTCRPKKWCKWGRSTPRASISASRSAARSAAAVAGVTRPPSRPAVAGVAAAAAAVGPAGVAGLAAAAEAEARRCSRRHAISTRCFACSFVRRTTTRRVSSTAAEVSLCVGAGAAGPRKSRSCLSAWGGGDCAVQNVATVSR